jgi:hypothetical protein
MMVDATSFANSEWTDHSCVGQLMRNARGFAANGRNHVALRSRGCRKGY